MSMTESERYTWWDDGEAYSNYIRPAVTKRLAEYEDIGTVSEFRELKEKATAKKVIYRKQSYGTPWLCPNCEADQVKVEFMSKDGSEPKKKHSFCWKCGCCIDWSEGKE